MGTALIAALLAAAPARPARAEGDPEPGTARAAAPREERIEVGGARLYAREIGRGQPIVVLHGGPDFDHC